MVKVTRMFYKESSEDGAHMIEITIDGRKNSTYQALKAIDTALEAEGWTRTR